MRAVAAELVDHEAGDVRLVGGSSSASVPNSEANTPPRSMSATITTGNRASRQTHVRQVAVAQVDLGRAAGALADDDVVARAQVGERAGDDRSELVLERAVGARVGVGVRLAHHDHLAVSLARRLDQHRVHRRLRLDAGGRRLHRLRAADLAAVEGHDRVERHVLRLERRDADPLALQPAADPGGDDRLAGIRVRAGDEQRALHRARCTAAAQHRRTASAAAPDGDQDRSVARRMSATCGGRPSPSRGRSST